VPGSSQPIYNCHHGSQEMWSQDKAQYCRLWLATSEDELGHHGGHSGGFSDEAESSPHECDESKEAEWDDAERDFCCILKGRGCPKVSAFLLDTEKQQRSRDRNSWEDTASLDVIDTAANKPAPGNFGDKLTFDCLDKDAGEWSETKKRWCCNKWGFCEELGTFNCSSGYWNWEKGWSGAKKDWCCKHEKRGCEDKKYDCTKETDKQDEASRNWCCENHLYSKTCPFACREGLDKWVTGFSTVKKKWCCKWEKLACPDHSLPLSPHPFFHAQLPHPLLHPQLHPQPPKPPSLGASHAPFRPGEGSPLPPHHTALRAPPHPQHLAKPHLGARPKREYTFADCQNDDDRSQDCVNWCCRMLGLCHLKVSFKCEVGQGSWPQWSFDKKQTCCGKQVACPHQPRQGMLHADLGGRSRAEWSTSRDVVNLHIGDSPSSGTKCVTPSKPVMCPEEAGNERDDDFPDRFRVYRKGGQLCVDRLDYKHLWGLDLVLKCIKMNPIRFQLVKIGSSLDSSTKCVPQTAPVSCDDAAAEAGRTDPHPDTFKIYHSRGKICAKRTDADSHWGLDLVLYCRTGGWNSGYWSPHSVRHLEDSFDEDMSDAGARPTERASWKLLAILPGFIAVLLGSMVYSASCKKLRSSSWWLQTEAEADANSGLRTARTPWVRIPHGDEGEVEVA